MRTNELVSYLTRRSTQVASGVALALYLPLALRSGVWLHPLLITLVAVAIWSSPKWAQVINLMEDRLLLYWPYVTAGRIGRLVIQLPINCLLLWTLVSKGLLYGNRRPTPGEIASVALWITLAAQGFQYLGIRLANRGLGHKHRNVLGALAGTALLVALADAEGRLFLVWLALLSTGALLAAAEGLLVVLSDMRSLFRPQGGIALFFGTFNPMHKTHIAIINRALQERGLERVLIHATVIPKLHRQALRKGEIEIVAREAGMRVYGTTQKADPRVSYFPTGNKFFEYETRALLIKLSLADAGLEGKAELISWCDIYEQGGFYGVVREVKRRYPGRRIHGLHGSDTGGMWNRAIYDESGWVYPFAVARKDGVSATAIRNGAAGMMTPTATAVVQELREGQQSFSVEHRCFTAREGVVSARAG